MSCRRLRNVDEIVCSDGALSELPDLLDRFPVRAHQATTDSAHGRAGSFDAFRDSFVGESIFSHVICKVCHSLGMYMGRTLPSSENVHRMFFHGVLKRCIMCTWRISE